MLENYIQRLQIPIFGDFDTIFKTKNNTLVAKGYQCIVIGGRGPYIEFSPEQIFRENVYIPENELKRIKNNIYYYIEYRTKDKAHVKIYFQKRVVDYADYKVGMFYVSPFDLLANDKIIIKKLNEKNTITVNNLW